jgi:hypothetical protein
VISALALAVFMINKTLYPVSFDSEQWKNWEGNDDEWFLRWDMMNSLRQNHELKGMEKAELIKLLGEPDKQSENQFEYFLGFSRRGINTGHLNITFNEKDEVVDFIVTDG